MCHRAAEAGKERYFRRFEMDGVYGNEIRAQYPKLVQPGKRSHSE